MIEELIARIKAALQKSEPSNSGFEFFRLYVETVSEVFLSALEYRLLLVYVSYPKIIIMRGRQLAKLWGASGEYASQ